jgi:uncharacterized membrane protein YidH (DUF202 family)
MTATPEHDGGEQNAVDASRRTSLAAERTWLAWWRTGLGAAAVAVGVGRILPGLTGGGARWPLEVLGLGYGSLAVAVLVIAAVRQNRVAEALRMGRYDQLSTRLVMWLTGTAVVLALGTLAVVAAGI